MLFTMVQTPFSPTAFRRGQLTNTRLETFHRHATGSCGELKEPQRRWCEDHWNGISSGSSWCSGDFTLGWNMGFVGCRTVFSLGADIAFFGITSTEVELRWEETQGSVTFRKKNMSCEISLASKLTYNTFYINVGFHNWGGQNGWFIREIPLK